MLSPRRAATAGDGRRLRIDRWLKGHLQRGDLHGLQWYDRPESGLFAVSWCHKSAHSWDKAAKQNDVFVSYSRDRFGSARQSDYKQLKQNLRCALRGSKHIQFEKDMSKSRGCEAQRVYRFIDSCSNSAEDGSGSEGAEAAWESALTDGELPCLDVADLDTLFSDSGVETSLHDEAASPTLSACASVRTSDDISADKFDLGDFPMAEILQEWEKDFPPMLPQLTGVDCEVPVSKM